MLKLITYGFLAIIAVIVVSIIIIRRRQKKRLEEARMSGIKEALREHKQYEALRKLEGNKQEDSYEDRGYAIHKGRRDITR